MILYNFFKIHSSAENIERTSDREVELTLAEPFQCVKVVKRAYAACVGEGYLTPFAEHFRKLFLHSPCLALDIDSMHKELIAVGRKPVEHLG